MSYTPSDYSEAPQFLQDFLFYLLTIKNRSKLTVENYYLDLRYFFRFIAQRRGIIPKDQPLDEADISGLDFSVVQSVTLTDIYAFFNHLTATGDGVRTRSRKASAIRGFFRYYHNIVQKLEVNPAENLELPNEQSSLPHFLTLEQSFDLLGSLDPESKSYARDFCILTLFLNCGMRLSELVGLNLSSIRDNTLTVLGKGNKERMLYLNDACLDAISAYLPERAKTKVIVDKEALFLSRSGTGGTRRDGIINPQAAAHRRDDDVPVRRNRPAGFAGDPRPCQPEYHPDLHPRLQPSEGIGYEPEPDRRLQQKETETQ